MLVRRQTFRLRLRVSWLADIPQISELQAIVPPWAAGLFGKAVAMECAAEAEWNPGQHGSSRVIATKKIALKELLTRTIGEDRYPLSPRVRKLKAILAKLDPQPIPTPITYPAPKQYKPPRAVLAKRRRAGR